MTDIVFRAGGNPGVSPGIFTPDGKTRLAFWPVDKAPTPENLDRVLTELIWTRETENPVGRVAIRHLLETAT